MFLFFISKKTGLEPAIFDVTGRRFNQIKLQFHSKKNSETFILFCNIIKLQKELRKPSLKRITQLLLLKRNQELPF